MRFHFALGPVQSFVSQARRTRDLWAGSFLLAYLTGQAIQAVLQAGGDLVFPAMAGEDAEGLRTPVDGEPFGARTLATIPNRFVAEVGDGFVPEDCVSAVTSSWNQIAEAVWTRFVEPIHASGIATADIWRRQIDGCWEITWAIGRQMDALDRRKNWRTHQPASEDGQKCAMMPHLQEISGHTRPDLRTIFWSHLSQQVKSPALGDDEQLSAVALVKRLFPLVSESAVGWKVDTHYPSTVALAVQPWLARQEKENAPWLESFRRQVRALDVEGILRQPGSDDVEPAVFYRDSLRNDRLWRQDSSHLREQVAKQLLEGQGSPSVYYAVLLMDGDSLGRLLREHRPNVLSASLRTFTQGVAHVVATHGGRLIYAGGDDVLALLPKPQAIACASALHQSYGKALADMHGTISAAILFAHMHATLSGVITEAHRLLDTVAKEENGRDSVAFAVWNSGGPTPLGVSKWAHLDAEGRGLNLQGLTELVGETLSSQFLFKIQDLQWRLRKIPLSSEEWKQLLCAELARTPAEETPAEPDRLNSLVEALLFLAEGYQSRDGLGLSSVARLVRFLASDGEVGA